MASSKSKSSAAKNLAKSMTGKNKATTTNLAEKAAAHWTAEQTEKVTGGKRYPLLPGEAPELLRELGLLNKDASMPADAVRKYGQINHLILQLEPHLKQIAKQHPCVRILDAGSGKSYLSFLLAWAFKARWSGWALSENANDDEGPSGTSEITCEILGVDSNARLMLDAQSRCSRLGYQDSLRFVSGSIAEYLATWEEVHAQQFKAAQKVREAGKALRPHATIALHACDTATDEALALGIKLKSDFIAVAPCCQAELAAAWKEFSQKPAMKEHPMAPVFHAPELRRQIAAENTDALRVLLLRSHGYEVTTTEFITATHTPKNRLILATRRGNYLESAKQEYERLKQHLGGARIQLEALLG
jgi:hypothetical protein